MAQNEPHRKETHHHYYLNISVEAANLSDWRIESKKNRFGSENRIKSKLFCPNWNALIHSNATQPRSLTFKIL